MLRGAPPLPRAAEPRTSTAAVAIVLVSRSRLARCETATIGLVAELPGQIWRLRRTSGRYFAAGDTDPSTGPMRFEAEAESGDPPTGVRGHRGAVRARVGDPDCRPGMPTTGSGVVRLAGALRAAVYYEFRGWFGRMWSGGEGAAVCAMPGISYARAGPGEGGRGGGGERAWLGK